MTSSLCERVCSGGGAIQAGGRHHAVTSSFCARVFSGRRAVQAGGRHHAMTSSLSARVFSGGGAVQAGGRHAHYDEDTQRNNARHLPHLRSADDHERCATRWL